MSDTPQPNFDYVGDEEAKHRATWLALHNAPIDWVLLTSAEIAVIRAERTAMREAIKAADWVFDELDQAKWPQSEADEYYGKAGKCPVNYDEAQALIKGVLYPHE